MDIDPEPASSGLQYSCPHCGAVEVDDYEVLSPDETHLLTCDGCRRRFYLALFECPHCGDEAAHAFANAPAPDELRQFACSHCGHGLIDHEDELRTMGLRR